MPNLCEGSLGVSFLWSPLSDLLNPRYLGFQLLLLLITHTQILFPSTFLANVIIQAYCDCRMNERRKKGRKEEKKRGCFTQIRSFYLIKNRKSLLFTKEKGYLLQLERSREGIESNDIECLCLDRTISYLER